MKHPCNDPPCAEALEKAERIGRAHYVCPVCKMDISLHYFLWKWAEDETASVQDALAQIEEIEEERKSEEEK